MDRYPAPSRNLNSWVIHFELLNPPAPGVTSTQACQSSQITPFCSGMECRGSVMRSRAKIHGSPIWIANEWLMSTSGDFGWYSLQFNRDAYTHWVLIETQHKLNLRFCPKGAGTKTRFKVCQFCTSLLSTVVNGVHLFALRIEKMQTNWSNQPERALIIQ